MTELHRQARWPQSFDFEGFNEPLRMEVHVRDLPVEGSVPEESDGVARRLQHRPSSQRPEVSFA